MRRRQKIYNFFLPHETNNYRAHALKHSSLFVYVSLFLILQLFLNLFYSTRPTILGFATSIYQNELIDLTNRERAKAGLNTLKENEELDKAAQLKAQDMFKEDYWAHISPTGINPWHWFDESGYQYFMAGENLARDFNTSQGVVSAWMNSSSHKENILNSQFTEIGMAVVNGKLKGEDTTLVVELFGRPQELVATSANGPETSGFTASSLTASSTVGQLSFSPTLLSTSEKLANRLQEIRGVILTTLNLSAWGWGQRIAIMMLLFLLALFILDSYVLHRERLLHLRKDSHSLLHGLMIVLLTAGVMASGIGTVI